MPLKLVSKQVGPWPMNTYAMVCEETQTSAIIDPGADADDILALVEGTRVGALDEVRKATGAPVYLHPADGETFDIPYDVSLEGLDYIEVGKQRLRVFHTPGHTPGQTCFDIGDKRVAVGDTLFVNGPGATETPEDFTTTMETIQNTILAWPDETEFFPGHGPSGIVGNERPAIKKFIEKGWRPDLCGDVTWKRSLKSQIRSLFNFFANRKKKL
jgi:hydroxyacylglutathione hydrolase